MYIWEMFREIRDVTHIAIIAEKCLLRERVTFSELLTLKMAGVNYVIHPFPEDGQERMHKVYIAKKI